MYLIKTAGLETVPTAINLPQKNAAKVAGSMFLFLILLFFTEKLITAQIAAATTKKITGLTLDIIYIASAFLLAFNLYQALKYVNRSNL